MGSPSSTMGTGTKLLLGLAFLGLVLASPLPQPQPLPLPFVEPFGLIGRLLGLQGSGTLNSFKPEKPKPFKPEEECICERTFHKKPDKKKKKNPKNPCDCYGAPESGYGAPSQPVSVIYSYEPLSNQPTTYSVPASPTPEPVYIEHKPIDGYGIPEAKPIASYNPAPAYEPTAPAYEPTAPFHEVPAPSYNSPAPTYNPPAPVYDAPAPVYDAPATVYEPKAPVYEAPVPVSYDPPAPVGYAAPAPVSYSPPAPVSYSPPAPAYASPSKPFTAFRPIYRSFEESPPQPLRPKFTYKLL